MRQIAEFMARVIIRKEEPAKIKAAVEQFRSDYQNVQYAFETATPAYKYVKVR